MDERQGRAKPWVVVVGGFLGAGNTTLLLAAAKELEGRGFRSGCRSGKHTLPIAESVHQRNSHLHYSAA
jgi:hypothetical protein